MEPGWDQRYALSPDIVSRVLDGEAVLLDIANGRYLGLNEVATRAWALIEEGKSFGEIHAALLAEFEVAAEMLRGDLARLVADMQARGLIRLR